MEKKIASPHGMHASFKQKRKLIAFMARHPELISSKITTSFTYADRQRLWQAISDECNALPGAKKHWKQWRKTWQDLRSKYKKHYKYYNGPLPPILSMLSVAELEAIGVRKGPLETNTTSHDAINSDTNEQRHTEFVPIDSETTQEGNIINEMENPEYSDPESLPEQKTLTPPVKHKNRKKNSNSDHSNNCVFNCELLAVQETKKIEMKQDYINFKKDYLRQKLKLIKEQTEAFKIIARELSKLGDSK